MSKKHKKSNVSQSEGFIFYVRERIPIPPVERYADWHHSWENYVDQLDELVEMHHKQLKTMNEIEKLTGINDYTLKELFKANGIKIYNKSEIAKMRRDRDFELLYDLHFNQKMSLNEIYRKYGYSPTYVRKAFEDKGIKHLNFRSQFK